MKLQYTGKHRLALPRIPVPQTDPAEPPEQEAFVVLTRQNPIQDYPHWERIKNKRPIKKLIESGQLICLDGRRLAVPAEAEPAPSMTLKEFKALNYKIAGQFVARSNDLDLLLAFRLSETRESVNKALDSRIQVLQDN